MKHTRYCVTGIKILISHITPDDLHVQDKILKPLRCSLRGIPAIKPDCFLLNLVVQMIAKALDAGNSLVYKPSSYTSLTVLKPGREQLEADMPGGAVNVVSCSGFCAPL